MLGLAVELSQYSSTPALMDKRASSPLLASSLPSVGLKPDRVEVDPGEETTALTLRVMVQLSLIQADASGHSPLDDLEPDFVPKAAKTANAPVVLSAMEDPAYVPAGYRAVSTVAQSRLFPAFVPKGGYALSKDAVNAPSAPIQTIDADFAQTKANKGPLASLYGSERSEFLTTLGEEFIGARGPDGPGWVKEYHPADVSILQSLTG